MIEQTTQGFWVISNDTHISKWAKESGRLDHDQNALPRILPHIKPNTTVIDAGAFIGDHTTAYAKVEGVTVYAFEPSNEAYSCLVLNVPENVKCFHAALSDRIENVFIESNENAGASSLKKASKSKTEQVIKTLTIDSFTFEKPISFIKIDVEGYEIRVLQGAKKKILEQMPTMVIEVNEYALRKQGESGKILMDLVRSLGYNIENIYENEPLEGDQFDILCIPK